MLAKGFAIKKELVNGKTVKEVGMFGDFNKSGARIIEMKNGKAKYTELSSQDIHQLLGIRSNPSDLLERLIPMLKLHEHKRHKSQRHRSHRRHKRSHKRHKRSHKRHKRSHRRHKRSHRRHKRSHKRHKRSHKSHRHKSHRHKRHKSHRSH